MKAIFDYIKEHEINCEYIDISDTQPIPQISVPVFVEGQENTYKFAIELMSIPNIDELVGDVGLIQFFVFINDEDPKSTKSKKEFDQLLPQINYNLALGSFNYHPSDHYLFYKYNLILDDQESGLKEILIKILGIITRHLNIFVPVFDQVRAGQTTFEELTRN